MSHSFLNVEELQNKPGTPGMNAPQGASKTKFSGTPIDKPNAGAGFFGTVWTEINGLYSLFNIMTPLLIFYIAKPCETCYENL
jgi:hypothetical protein